MSLAGTLRRGVKTIQRATSSLQEPVAHNAWVGQDGFGVPIYAHSQDPLALVEQRTHLRQLSDGRLVEVRAKLTFLQPLEPNGAAGRVEPLDLRDQFTLADGTVGPVVDIQGFRNPEEGKPFLLEVYLGSRTTTV